MSPQAEPVVRFVFPDAAIPPQSAPQGTAGPADVPAEFGLIAGSGVYPKLFAEAARKAGVRRLAAACFEGETDPALAALVDECEWMRVGQLGRLVKFFKDRRIPLAVMAGQIAPKNLFDLRPDIKAILLLSRLRERNAESIFGAIAGELAQAGVTLAPATTFLEHLLAPKGHIAGRHPRRSELEDIAFGLRIAKEISRLDIGQTVLVREGTVLAVEAFEGTNEAIRRGGALGKGAAVMVKVSKPDQDMRFDVPVIGLRTIETAAEAGVSVIAVEAGKTLLLEREKLAEAARRSAITLWGA